MSINTDAMRDIQTLRKTYKEIWGNDVDFSVCPPGMSQERMVECLEWMLKSNDSLLTAYNKLYHGK